MRFQLVNEAKERMLNALFPGFSERLQIACLRYPASEYMAVLVTSGDEVDTGDFEDEDCYAISICWGAYQGGIEPVFEEGDPYVTELPENTPDDAGFYCEFGELGDRFTARFFGRVDGDHVTAFIEDRPMLNWCVRHHPEERYSRPADFSRLMSEDTFEELLKAERKRRGIKLFD